MDTTLDQTAETRLTIANWTTLFAINPTVFRLPNGWTHNMFTTELMTHTGRLAKVKDTDQRDEGKSYEGLPAAVAFIEQMRTLNPEVLR